jgi:signal transduction histidine kinase
VSHPENPPPWWPADLRWPPDEDAWRANRRRLLRRVLLTLTLFALVIVTITMFATQSSRRDWDHNGPPFPLMVLFGFGVLFLIIRLVRNARALWTYADVMHAVDRVAEGDYSVRVPEQGKGDVRQLAVSFNTMAERLAENDARRREFFADVAHELRTPLSVVRGNIEAMIDGVYPADSEHLEPLLDEIALITRLLEDLQLLATAEAGGLKLHRETVAVREFLTDIVAGFTPKADEAGVQFRVNAASDLAVSIDPMRIQQVLVNLISNALRYTPTGGSITISAERSDSELTVSVADTGSGMTGEQRAVMFDRFVKSADSGGSGLGLAIARGLVEAHSGGIGAKPTPDGGTTVWFTLPARNTL